MLHRQILRLATLTAFVFFIHTSVAHAQRTPHNAVLYDATEGPGGKITGIVSGESGPMEGVRVSLISHGNVVLVKKTDKNGAYTFSEILPGMYDVSFYKADYRKRVINEIPVVETYQSDNDIKLSPAKNSWEERTPKMSYYDKLENHKIEKIAGK